MNRTDERMDMRLAPDGGRDMLIYLMKTYRHSCRTLADAVTAELDRRHRQGGFPKATCSKSHIGNLRSGASRVVSREIASAIEEILQIQPGVLFVPKMSSVQSPRSYPGRVRAAGRKRAPTSGKAGARCTRMTPDTHCKEVHDAQPA